ncbi:MAG: helix-turn-helix transcriptional regulator [Clostridia bacterium]|nr:helix-turn-helix transcriptional regulator [Clostridia bacterium]
MFDTLRFGNALSALRKNADMTQSEVADKLNLTRQAVSKYERGESFPDISILLLISELFGVTLDKLVSFGGATEGEAACRV